MAKSVVARQFLTTTTVSATTGTSYVNWDAKAMTIAVGTYYSSSIRHRFGEGDAALLVLTSAGSLAITYEVSDNGKDFYDPYDTTESSIGSVASALSANRWIVFEPTVQAEYIRFKFVLTGADSTVSATIRWRERT